MSYNYVVTAYKGTAVTAAQTGNFTGPEDINLIQAKGSSLVVSVVTPEGLKPVADVSIYGRINLMQLFRPKVHRKPVLVYSAPALILIRAASKIYYMYIGSEAMQVYVYTYLYTVSANHSLVLGSM